MRFLFVAAAVTAACSESTQRPPEVRNAPSDATAHHNGDSPPAGDFYSSGDVHWGGDTQHAGDSAPTCVTSTHTTADLSGTAGIPGTGTVAAVGIDGGTAYIVVDGDIYAQEPVTCAWEFVFHVYDTDFFTTHYTVEAGDVFLKNDGDPVAVNGEFSDTYEAGLKFADLLATDLSRYTSATLLSPAAPSVSAYNALRHCLADDSCDFLDNRIEFSMARSHSGTSSLRFETVAPDDTIVTSKASVSRALMYYAENDDLYFRFWIFVETSLPFTVLDLESTWLANFPGPRIVVEQNGCLAYQLAKWIGSPTYRQTGAACTPVPIGEWVEIKGHLRLSASDSGLMELWQNSVQVISTNGQTLPVASAVLDHLELGITASDQASVIYLDDVRISKTSSWTSW